MQYDMHYYGTYAMAAAAGIPKADAEVIAHASQYVDDQDHTTLESARTANNDICEAVVGIATAHHPFAAGVLAKLGALTQHNHHRKTTVLADDSRLVWVPFHFLPGKEGGSFLEKIVCQKDSPIANEMIGHHIQMASEHTFDLHLMGIAAHVYADTFAHYGFSGVPSHLNSVDVDSVKPSDSHSPKTHSFLNEVSSRFRQLFEKPIEQAVNKVHLGHGGVATCPDQPFLNWEFRYSWKDRKEEERSNPCNYMEACQKLYDYFAKFAERRYDEKSRIEPVPFASIENQVRSILKHEGEADERAEQWMNAMKNGLLGTVAPCARYDEKSWTENLHSALKKRDATEIKATNAFRFHAAAEFHRHYVLKQLLPSHDLIIA